jgi:hypothetical protein
VSTALTFLVHEPCASPSQKTQVSRQDSFKLDTPGFELKSSHEICTRS